MDPHVGPHVVLVGNPVKPFPRGSAGKAGASVRVVCESTTHDGNQSTTRLKTLEGRIYVIESILVIVLCFVRLDGTRREGGIHQDDGRFYLLVE
jgi:hypothetical protein